MSSSSVATPPNVTSAQQGATSPEVIQRLIDQVAGFNLFVVPQGGNTTGRDLNGLTGFAVSADLHRFNVVTQRPTSHEIQATNLMGENVGRVDLRWSMIPDNFVARPDRQPPQMPVDSSISQRFVMQETTFSFADGRDGFRSFGTGRTFPMMVGRTPRVVVGGIGNITEGFGKFRGHEGNFTMCGDLTPNGFKGNILVRVQDNDGGLRTQGELPSIQPQPDPDPETTYLLWTAQKGTGPDQENSASFGPDGQLRGLNIPTQLKLLELDYAVANGFQARDIKIGEVIGREIGFGRGSIPGADPSGTPLNPFRFYLWRATASLIQEERPLGQSPPMFLKDEGSTCACLTRLPLRDSVSVSSVLSYMARASSKILKECSMAPLLRCSIHLPAIT